MPAVMEMCPFILSENIYFLLLNTGMLFTKALLAEVSLAFASYFTSVNHFELPTQLGSSTDLYIDK